MGFAVAAVVASPSVCWILGSQLEPRSRAAATATAASLPDLPGEATAATTPSRSAHEYWGSVNEAASLPASSPLFFDDSGYRATRGRHLTIGDLAPDFEADTTGGRIRFHDWLGDSWGILFSDPRDFTAVGSTELAYMASIKPEFDQRNTKIIGLTVDSVAKHAQWANDIASIQGVAPTYPLIADEDFSVSRLYGMLGDPSCGAEADRQITRNVFVIGPDKKIKLVLVYPMTTGRNFDEILRVIDSLQLTARHRVATPAQWQQGDNVIIATSVTDEQASAIYPEGWDAPRPYIRIVAQPTEPGSQGRDGGAA